MEQDSSRPTRRDVLLASAVGVAVPAVGASATASRSTSDATTRDAPPRAFEPLGSVDLAGTKEVIPRPDGDVAFAAISTGFATVDVSDPANPTVLAEERALTDDGGDVLQQVWDVKYDDDRLLVASGANGAGSTGFYLYDVSDPASPERIGDWYPTEWQNHNTFFEDGVAYFTGILDSGQYVVAIDVSEPPFEELGRWSPGDWNADWQGANNMVLHDLYVQDGRAYCAYWDAGTFIVDVSDPADMSFVSRVGDYDREDLRDFGQKEYVEPEGNDHYVAVNEDATVMAEGGESWDVNAGDGSGGPSGITLFDVSDETNPQRLAHIDAPKSGNNRFEPEAVWTTSHNFELVNDRLYASWYQGGVTVHDVSDPANPERVAWWADPDERCFWGAFLAAEGEFFVGGSFVEHGTTAGVLTFPDRGGRVTEPPESVEWDAAGAYPEAVDGSETSTTTTEPASTAPTSTAPTESGGGTTAGSGPTSEAATTSASGGESDGSGDGEDGGPMEAAEDLPGFGVLATLGGLGLGAARVLRGRGGADED